MIFIDSLCLTSSLLAYRLAGKEKKQGSKIIILVLDPIKKTVLSWVMIRWLRVLGILIKEAEFFSGDLRTKDGGSIYITAKHILTKISYKLAERTIDESSLLSSLNSKWGQNTVLLYLAKYFWHSAAYSSGYHTIFKILIADALSRSQTDDEHHLILGLPRFFTTDLFEDINGSPNLNTYPIKEWSIRKNRFSVLLLITFISLKRLLSHTTNIFKSKPIFGDVKLPALLLFQEDDLSMDRSYRSQPHWLFNNDPAPKFRSLVLESNIHQVRDCNELEQYQVYSFQRETMFYYFGNHTVHKKINSSIRALLVQSFFGPHSFIDISFHLAMLFIRARLLASFCEAQNVKGFMVSENYYHDADSMNLIGPHMGIHTISFQYSNMSEINPPLLTSASTMCTFSPLFHERWCNNRIQPQSFIDIGYLFDSSFDLVEERATAMRKQLKSNGAQFILCFFDENIQENKYGVISMNDHLQEIETLSKLIVQDPSSAVIIKTQFRKNTPSIMFKENKIIESAKTTGRFIELFQGKHRNIVFPAEAAMAADFVIAHSIGATAALEAVLSGRRCILLDPYGMNGSNNEIFKQANILYDSMDSALNAVSLFREGMNEYKNLGDWSSIINLFDAFQDRQSSVRLREIIEEKILV